MTGNKPGFSYDDLFPERWLHADALQGKQVTLMITAAYLEKLRLPGGAIDVAGILSFAHTNREYVLNKTNAMVLGSLWSEGEDTKQWKSSDWIGHRITLAAVPDDSGKSTSGYKILFVGTPEIDKPTRVLQPQKKTRIIHPTGKDKAPAPVDGVDAITGEVIGTAPDDASDLAELNALSTVPDTAEASQDGSGDDDGADDATDTGHEEAAATRAAEHFRQSQLGEQG